MVCHRKLESDVEAIKPYVCDNPLCLYQYMTLGFGPSIEHEVIAQPYVVDLLVSFCYNSAAGLKLHDFPDGLSLVVPPIRSSKYNPAGSNAATARKAPKHARTPDVGTRDKFPTFDVKYLQGKGELIFAKGDPEECPVRCGQWIVLTSSAITAQDLHCRVAGTTFFPTISIDNPVSENGLG